METPTLDELGHDQPFAILGFDPMRPDPGQFGSLLEVHHIVFPNSANTGVFNGEISAKAEEINSVENVIWAHADVEILSM